MAKTRTIRTKDQRMALTASSEVIDLSKPVYQSKSIGQKTQEWQRRAWQMYDEIGEVANAANYMGDAFANLRLFIGTNIDGDVVEIEAENLEELPGDVNVTPDQIQQAQDALYALNYPHGLEELQRMYGINLFQVGEAYLLGHTNADNEEEWDVHSTEQIFTNDVGKRAIRELPSDSGGKEISDDDFLLRTWRRDPRWSGLAMSSVKPALMILEELLLLTLEVRAITTSRIPAGILAFPSSMEIVQTDQSSDDPSDNGAASVLLKAIQEHLTAPIKEPGSASAVVPFLMKGEAEDIGAIREISFGRELSAQTADMRRELIERFADAINLPGEVLKGKGGLNHWSAWLVDTEALNNHIQPLAKIMTNGLTSKYLIPRLTTDADGNKIEGDTPPLIIGFEAAERLDDPEQSAMEFEAYDRILISSAAMAKRLGIKDEELPTPEEYAERQASKQKAAAPVGPSNAPPDPSRIASARPPKHFRLSQKERELRVRLQVAADQVMTRALERAGAKLRSLAQRDKATKEKIAASSIPNELLIAHFPEVLLSLNHTPDALLQGSFEQYADYWDVNVEDSQDNFVDSLSDGLSDGQIKQIQQQYKVSRQRAKELLIAGLTTLGAELAYNPSPAAPAVGEFEPSLRIPSGFIRNSLILAGGGATTMNATSSPISTNGIPETGLFSAPISYGALNDSTAVMVEPGYVWIYGDRDSRKQPFEPHFDLDEKTFASWDDEEILGIGGEDWVDSENGCFYPGDHDGCQCDFDYNISTT